MAAIIEAIDLHKTYHIGKIEVPALRGISQWPKLKPRTWLFKHLGDSESISLQNRPLHRSSCADHPHSRQKLADFIGCLQVLYFGHREV